MYYGAFTDSLVETEDAVFLTVNMTAYGMFHAYTHTYMYIVINTPAPTLR